MTAQARYQQVSASLGSLGGVRAEVYFGSGCHTGAFFNAQEPPSLAFLARHLG